MKISVKPGKYIVAVSGGVDSVVLLDLLANQPNLELVIAHFDHGIRKDSHKDAQFVTSLAKKYGLRFELGKASLGKNASESTARMARYKFLRAVKRKCKADAIITAHHQDDVLETAFINILRGTGPQGLVALRSAGDIKRPLLKNSKRKILAYAKQHKLDWTEDSTNLQDKYLRNYLRHHVLNKISVSQKNSVLSNLEKVAKNRKPLQQIIATYSQYLSKEGRIDRQLFSSLPANVGNEFLVYWFRQSGFHDFDKKTLSVANNFIRTGLPKRTFEASNHLTIQNTKHFSTLVIR